MSSYINWMLKEGLGIILGISQISQIKCINVTQTAVMTQSQLVCSFQSQGVNKILRACRNFGNVDVVEMGQIKVFVQKLGLTEGRKYILSHSRVVLA